MQRWLWSERGRYARRWLWTFALILCVTGYILRHFEVAGILLALPGGWLLVYLISHQIEVWREEEQAHGDKR